MTANDHPTPAGEGEYIVAQGECLSSIAFENGILEDNLWNHPANAALRARRKDRRILLPGDRLYVPPIDPGEYDRPTDALHKFRRLSVHEKLRIVLRDSKGKPRPNLRYFLTIERKLVKQGTTSPEGLIEASILPNARDGHLHILDPHGDEHYDLHLGALDPPPTVSGWQARLNNLGFHCGEVDGIVGPHTRAAIRAFQRHKDLPITGDLDHDTRNALVSEHNGF